MSTVEPPTPLSSPAPAAATPGQAARAAWHEHWNAAPGHGRGTPGYDVVAHETAAWEAGAQAAITAGTGKILAQAATWKRERDEARQERDRYREALKQAMVALEEVRDGTALGDVITRGGTHVHVTAREAARSARAALGDS